MRRLLLLLLLLAALASPAVAAPSPSPTQEPEDPIKVVVTNLVPRYLTAAGGLQVVGELTNTGTRRVDDLRIRLQIGARITTRSELHQADTDRPPTWLAVEGVPASSTLGPGEATQFVLRTDVRTLGLRGIGVYPVDIVARGDAGDGRDSLGLAPTYLPWFDRLAPRPTRIAVLWPLTDMSHRGPDGAFLDDDLADTLSAHGRLGRLLEVAREAQQPECEPAVPRLSGDPDPAPTRCESVRVSFAVEPDLLETVARMTTGYQVGTKPGAGTSAAASWLARLRGADLANRLIALPFADPDVTALTRGDDPRQREDLSSASALGAEVTMTVLGVDPDRSVAWPPPGTVPPAAASALALTGARAVVLDPGAYAEGVPAARTPDARSLYASSSTGAELTGLVVDPDLTALLGAPHPAGARLAEQRFLAETAIVSLQAPGLARTLLIALPRGSSVDAPSAVQELRDLGRVPWLCPVPLADVAEGRERCVGETLPTPPEPAARGDVRTDAEGALSAAFLRRVAGDRDRVTQFTNAILSPDPAAQERVAEIKGQLRRAVARSQSALGRTDPDTVRTQATLLRREVDRLTGGIVVRGGRALLTSSKGSLSVSVENSLPWPVQVRVRFTSKTATLSDAETELLTISAENAVQAKVTARAQRSGQFVVFAQIIDRDGQPFGDEAEVLVRSTQYGRLALAVTFAGAAVLLVAAGIRIARRARSGRGTTE